MKNVTIDNYNLKIVVSLWYGTSGHSDEKFVAFTIKITDKYFCKDQILHYTYSIIIIEGIGV
jgi:hypothetical protein